MARTTEPGIYSIKLSNEHIRDFIFELFVRELDDGPGSKHTAQVFDERAGLAFRDGG